jgi:hypothetical protein
MTTEIQMKFGEHMDDWSQVEEAEFIKPENTNKFVANNEDGGRRRR